jgi:hypothetical protein
MVSNFYRIFKNKKSMFIIWFIILIPFIDLIQLLISQKTFGVNYHPAFSFFLAGSTQGHIGQIVLLWFLPIYFLILCSDEYIQEVKNGYNRIIISKLGQNVYFRTKLFISFIVPCITMFISLTINLIFSYIIFKGGAFSKGFFERDTSSNLLTDFSQQHPFITAFTFLLIVCFFSGLVGVLGASACLVFPDRRYAYPIAYFIWFILIFVKGSVMNIFQPFTEYDIDDLLPILIIDILLLLVIPLLTYIYKIKRDEF